MARNKRLEDLHKLESLLTDHRIAEVAFKNAHDKLKQLAAVYEKQVKVCDKKKAELETVYAAMMKKGEELRIVKDGKVKEVKE